MDGIGSWAPPKNQPAVICISSCRKIEQWWQINTSWAGVVRPTAMGVPSCPIHFGQWNCWSIDVPWDPDPWSWWVSTVSTMFFFNGRPTRRRIPADSKHSGCGCHELMKLMCCALMASWLGWAEFRRGIRMVGSWGNSWGDSLHERGNGKVWKRNPLCCINNNLLHIWSWVGSQMSWNQGFGRCFLARKVGDNNYYRHLSSGCKGYHHTRMKLQACKPDH